MMNSKEDPFGSYFILNEYGKFKITRDSNGKRIIESVPYNPKDEWHSIHSFGMGWGYYNEFKKQTLHCFQVKHLLNKELHEGCDFDAIYNEMQPLLEKDRQEMKEYFDKNPVKFDKISIPKIKRLMPKILTDDEKV
jgi:hypothetical protein